ncbi:unnamed protein product [Calypogeia fissa]
MRNMMITDHQYHALMARSGGGPSSVSSQLLAAQNAQYVSRKLYTDRAAAAADPYHQAEGRLPSLAGSAAAYAPANRAADSYPGSQDIRAQVAAEGRGALHPSPALVDYSTSSYADQVVGSRVLAGATISSEPARAYSGHYPSPTPQRAGLQPLSNAELLAARVRRSEAAASHPGGYGTEARRIPAASSYDEPALLPGQAPGILGAGTSARRGRELDQYLLSVQPEKLVRYAASVLAPEPVLRRSAYPIARTNLHPEDDDRYSNYRRAKARRTGSHEFGGGIEPGSQRVTERDVYRDREQYRGRRGGGGESGGERGRRSPGRRETNGSLSKSSDAHRLDRPNNTSQSSEGQRGQRNGGQNKRSRPSESSGKVDKRAEPKEKVDNPESDKDSELGSLCADLSDSDEEKVEKKSDDAATVIDTPLAGMIFGCSSATFHECMRLQLFGLPAKSKDDVMRVTPGTKVFLFNFDTKELSGIFEAITHGGWQLQPDAFRDFGGFPAQVQVFCSEQCPNIPQSMFKSAIRENYVSQTRFRFDLNTKQVKDLVRMFRQAARNDTRQQDPLADRYLSARLQSEDYLARGGQQQRTYSRHPQARFGKSRVPYARVISVSANNSMRKSKRGSKRTLKGRKKRKVSNKPQSPMADNCSLYSVSGEIQEAEVTINASGCDDTSNTNNPVIVREGIETGNSRNADEQKEIIETPAAKGIAPSGPDHVLSPSKPEEFPELQSDLGKQVSFLKDSCNDGNFRLAGSRADERGQGLGLDVLQGALSSGTVIKSSDCTHSSICEGIGCEVQGDFITTGPAKPPVNLGGNNVPKLAPTTGSEGHLSELDEKRSREVLGATSVPAYDNSHSDLTLESISTECGTGRKLGDVHVDVVLMESVETDCKLSLHGKNDELEVMAAEVTVGPEAPYARGDVLVDVVGKNEELEVIACEVAIDSEAPFIIEKVRDPSAVVGQDEELDVISGEALIDYEAPCVSEEVMVVPGAVGNDEKLIMIAAEVAMDSEVPCVREEMGIAAGAASEDKTVGIIAAVVAVDSETEFVRENVMLAYGALGKDEDEELEVVPAEVALFSDSPCVREERMPSDVAFSQELEVDAAEVAVDCEAPCVREERMPSDVAFSQELEVDAAEVAVDYEAPCIREDRMPTDGAFREEPEMIAAEVAVDSEASFDREEAVIADGACGKDGELEVIATELAVESETPYIREEVMIVAQAPSSQLLAPADVDDNVILHDAFDQGEEVILAEEAADSEQPSPALNVIHGADDEEEVLLAGNPVDSDHGTSADEDEDEVGKHQEYEYDEDDEDEETVDVSVDGELSNVGDDDDEGEDNEGGVDDDASYDD